MKTSWAIDRLEETNIVQLKRAQYLRGKRDVVVVVVIVGCCFCLEVCKLVRLVDRFVVVAVVAAGYLVEGDTRKTGKLASIGNNCVSLLGHPSCCRSTFALYVSIKLAKQQLSRTKVVIWFCVTIKSFGFRSSSSSSSLPLVSREECSTAVILCHSWLDYYAIADIVQYQVNFAQSHSWSFKRRRWNWNYISLRRVIWEKASDLSIVVGTNLAAREPVF